MNNHDQLASLRRRRLLQLAALSTPVLSAPFVSPLAFAQNATDTLRVGDQTRTTHSLLEAAGLLKSVPYNLQFSQFPTAAPVMEALNAGAIDIGYGGDAATTFTLATGNPSKIVGAYRSDPACIALIIPKNSPIKSVTDLVGKKVAVSRGSVGHLLVAKALQKHNLPPDSVEYRFLQPADAYPAFASGAVDAWAIWTIYIARAQHDHGARVLINGRGLVNNTAYHTARNDALDKKRPLIKDYLERVAKARVWAINNLDAYAKVWAPMIGATEKIAREAYSMERMLPVKITQPLIADQQTLVKYYADSKIIPAAFDIAPAFDTSFNDSVIEA